MNIYPYPYCLTCQKVLTRHFCEPYHTLTTYQGKIPPMASGVHKRYLLGGGLLSKFVEGKTKMEHIPLTPEEIKAYESKGLYKETATGKAVDAVFKEKLEAMKSGGVDSLGMAWVDNSLEEPISPVQIRQRMEKLMTDLAYQDSSRYGHENVVAEVERLAKKLSKLNSMFGEKQSHTPRGKILMDALNLTEGDRNATYGDPKKNLEAFAKLVEGYLIALGWTGPPLDATDGSIIMNQAKVSRIAVNKKHRDNYLDGSAYMAIGGECAGV